jgi:hypothetical protein
MRVAVPGPLRAALERRPVDRAFEARKLRSPALVASAESTTLAGPADGEWSVVSRQLVVAHEAAPGGRIGPCLRSAPCRELPAGSDAALAAAVGWLFRYPRFLADVPAWPALAFLRARAGLRLAASAVALRDRHADAE